MSQYDDPGVPDKGMALMQAAQKQVGQLQAEVQAGRKAQQELLKAQRWTKVQVRILGAVAIALLVVVGILGTSLTRQADLYGKLHDQQVQSCQYGNSERASEKRVWDSFIDLLLKGNKDPVDIQKGKQFKEFIAQVDAPRNCRRAFAALETQDG